MQCYKITIMNHPGSELDTLGEAGVAAMAAVAGDSKPPRASLLALGLVARLAVSLALIAGLWLLVAWAR